VHDVPQTPQWLLSVVRSKHDVPHIDWPKSQLLYVKDLHDNGDWMLVAVSVAFEHTS
jgi:hypothetical protein